VKPRSSRILALSATGVALAVAAALAPASAPPHAHGASHHVSRDATPWQVRTAQPDTTPARTSASAALREAKALFSGKLARQQRAAARMAQQPFQGIDATSIMMDLYAARPAMTRAQRAQADAILARPSDAGGDCLKGDPCQVSVQVPADPTYAVPTGSHFLIHYGSASLPDAQATAAVLEHVWGVEVNKLGFRPPRNDHTTSYTPSPGDGNPDSRVDVYLANLQPYGIYGYCAPDPATSGGYYYKSTAYCVLDDDFVGYSGTPANSRAVTAAHEFFHAIQFGYNFKAVAQNRWFSEGSAVWMEDEVYPAINDYFQYLPASPIMNPMVPFTTNGYFSVYGDFALYKFLQGYTHDPNFVKKMWAQVGAYLNMTPMRALARVLAADHSSLAKALPVFGLWNTLPPHTYPDRAAMLRLLRAHHVGVGVWKIGSLKVGKRSKWLSPSVRPLATAPLVVLPKGRQARAKAKIAITAPRTGGVWIQLRMKNGIVKRYHFGLNRKGKGTHKYAFKPRQTAAIVITMTNTAVSGNARRFRVQVTLMR
jgi:hypothetical protein